MRQAEADRLALMRVLFPELATRLDDALAAHANHDEEGAAVAFDAWLDARAHEVLPSASAAAISDAAAAERFDRFFRAARRAAERVGAVGPELEAFAAAGVDIAALGAAMSADPSLVPVPAPYGLGADRWLRAFGNGAPRLLLADEAEREFAVLDSAPAQAPVSLASSEGGAGSAPVRTPWTLRLIPASKQPPLLGLAFAHGPHATLPEMLMLQLARLELGEALLDVSSFTWLAGDLAAGRLAARHVYDEAEHAVRITCREVVSQGPHLGARPPIG